MASPREDLEMRKSHRYKNCTFPNTVVDSSIEALQTIDVRPDDVWVVTYPKSGTHWMLEIVGLLHSDGDPGKVDRSLTSSTVCFIDLEQKLPTTREEELASPPDRTPFINRVQSAGSPRVMQTHIQLELLPPNLTQRAKVIYIARNPKDVINSYFNFFNSISAMNNSSWDRVLQMFMDDENFRWYPWFDHVTEFWKIRHEKNVLFLFYEDLKKDLTNSIRHVAEHLGIQVTEETLRRIAEHSSFTGMKRTYDKARDTAAQDGKANFATCGGPVGFMKRGSIGQWKDRFTVAQNEVFDKWYQDKMADTDLEFTFE